MSLGMVNRELEAVLEQLREGKLPRDIETRHVDVKEEPGRRRQGKVQPGKEQHENAAVYVTGELSCMANTPGGGALIIGIADDGQKVGTELSAEWLRHRVYELSSRRITPDIHPYYLDGTRLLIATVFESMEPIPWKNSYRWRVGDHCVEIDPTTLRRAMELRMGMDWSAMPSKATFKDVSLSAVEAARSYLDSAGTDTTRLREAGAEDFLKRLNVLLPDGSLTHAGELLFVGVGARHVEYVRRDTSVGDSRMKERFEGPLFMTLQKLETYIAAANPVHHVPSAGFQVSRMESVPPSVAREAIVNALSHRDWFLESPLRVEFIGETLEVTSPGGFVGSVRSENIITHPSTPRNKSLAHVFEALGLSEREGIGVDRMFSRMLWWGHAPPVIEEIAGPHVRVTLRGGPIKTALMGLLRQVRPAITSEHLEELIVVHELARWPWIDAARCASALQRSPENAEQILRKLEARTYLDQQVVVPVPPVSGHIGSHRIPGDGSARVRKVWTLNPSILRAARETFGVDPLPPAMGAVAWLNEQGTTTTSQLAALLGISVQHAGRLLKSMVENGEAVAERAPVGRAVWYRRKGE